MALKAHRHALDYAVDYVMNSTAEPGGCLALKTGASGLALDSSKQEVEYAANPSGKKPVGILLSDVVNKDLTQTHLNFHKDEVQVGSKVSVLRKGWVVTNKLYPGVTPKAGDDAYMAHSGLFSNANHGQGPKVGVFKTGKDENGWATVEINLP